MTGKYFDPTALNARRTAAGLSVHQLGRLVDRPHTVIVAAESGDAVPSRAFALRLAGALGCGIDDLLTDRLVVDDDAEFQTLIDRIVSAMPPMTVETREQVHVILAAPDD